MPDLGYFGPLVAFAILALAIFARDGLKADKGKSFLAPGKGDLIGSAIFVILLAILAFWNLKVPAFSSGPPIVLLAFVGGALASMIAHRIGRAPAQEGVGRTAPIALAALAIACLELLGPNAPLAAVFGGAAAAWLLGLKDQGQGSSWAVRATIFMLCIYACDSLSLQLSPPVHGLGLMLAWAGVISGILGLGVGEFASRRDDKLAFVGPALAFALLILCGYLIFRRAAMDNSAEIAFLFAAVLAILVAWVANDEEAVVARTVLAAVLWVALATAVFGYAKTLGMAIALTGACFMTSLLAKDKALLAVGPLGALVIYRLFRILHPDSAVAFDIGQHYALIGFLLGVMIPILAIEWQRKALTLAASKSTSAGVLWVLLMAAAPIPIAITLSDKGIVGYLVGLGLASVLDALRGASSPRSLSLSLGLSCSMVFLYGWLAPHLDMDRAGKLHALIWILTLMAIAAIGIAVLSRPKTENSPA